MKKVFHIITHFDLGGAEQVAINMVKSKTQGIEYHLVEVIRGESDFTQKMLDEFHKNHIKYHRSPINYNKLGIVFFPLWFLFLYVKYRPTVIHTHTEIPDLSIYLFHFLYPWHKIYIRTIHNTELWNNWKWIGKNVERFFIKHKSNVAISEAVKESYKKNYHATDVPLIYNGVEIKEQTIFPQLVTGKKNILFAGRLEEQKGIKVLIEVVNRLKDNEEYFFHIIGNGSQKNELFKLKGNNFRLYDKVYNLASYIGSFDYVFMPSNFEGLALTAIEACMSKTPVIINSCKGLEEIFPSDWPLKIKNNSIDNFVNIFNHELPHIDRHIFAEIVYQHAVKNFSIKQMQEKYEELYYEKTKV